MKPVLTHLALGCGNLARSIEFYSRHAALHVVHDRNDGGMRVVWLSERKEQPDFVLVLFEIPVDQTGPRSTLQHLGFAVGSCSEVDQAATEARAAGVLVAEPVYAGPIVGYFCIVADPDGNRVEFSYGQPINPRELPAST